MTPKLVIFDCDGVLADTEPVSDRVISANLARHGLQIAPDEVHRMFAGGTLKGVGETARQMGAELPPDWVDGMYAEVFDALAAGVPVMPGVADLIARLDAAGIARAIASNGPVRKMEISLSPSGLFTKFAGRIYSGHDHGPKPAPDMLLRIAADLGVAPADAVMIDDMPAGFKAAKAAGMRCFGYVADGDPARIGDTGAIPVTQFSEIADALGLA